MTASIASRSRIGSLAGRLATRGATNRPSPVLLVLAAIGATLLVVVATSHWSGQTDEHAYWLAARHLVDGQNLYDATATPGTPGLYWYPPPLAQVLVPLVIVLPQVVYA